LDLYADSRIVSTPRESFLSEPFIAREPGDILPEAADDFLDRGRS
jgi:hypothetical protein